MGCSAGPDAIDNGLVLALDAADANSYQQNEISEPTDMYGWYTTIKGDSNANVCTITRDTTTASPVGNEPLKMVVTGSDPYLLCYNSSPWNLAPASQGETWVVSVYVKASTNTSIQLFIFGGNSSGGVFSPTDYSASTINVTTEWKRYSHYHTFAQSATQYVQVRLDGPDTQSGGDANGQEIWWDGLQVERVPSGTTTPGRFNSNSKTFEDLSGRGNNGTLTNSPRRDFDNGGSLVFDGTNDYISFDYDLRSDWTYECWVNKDSKDNFSFLGQGTTSANNGLHINMYSDRLRFGMYSNDTDAVGLYSNTSTGVWYHYAFSYNHSTYVKKIYRNGVSLSVTPAQTQTAYQGTGIVRIGAQYSSGSTYANGKISNSKLYNRVLTDTEVKQNFNALRGRFGI